MQIQKYVYPGSLPTKAEAETIIASARARMKASPKSTPPAPNREPPYGKHDKGHTKQNHSDLFARATPLKRQTEEPT